MTIKDIENGTHKKYRREYKNTHLYTIYKGKAMMYNNDETMPGVTVHFQNKNDNAATIVYCDNIKRANEIIEYQEKHKVAIHEQQQAIGNYIRKHKMY